MTKILVIDDAPEFLLMLDTMLSDSGYQPMIASNGIEGLKLMHDDPATLALVDIFMPDKDGFETITALRQQFPDCSVIAMSGMGCINSFVPLTAARQLGADDTLMKPFKRQELLSKISNITKR